jgi:predicted DNA-binding transcriptional regulator YafY
MSFSDDEELLTERELAEYLNRSQRQLQRDRAERRGIPFILVEKQVRYRRGDVRAYMAQHRRG